MDAGKFDIEVSRNAMWARELQFTDDVGVPIDLTGMSGRLQVRTFGGADGVPLIDLPTVAADREGLCFIDRPNGYLQIRFDWPTIAALPGLNEPEIGVAKRFSYDLILTDSDGFAWRPIEGFFIVLAGVTRHSS